MVHWLTGAPITLLVGCEAIAALFDKPLFAAAGRGLMEPFRLAVALIPLGVYFLAIGLMNTMRRPWVTSGARDFLALALGLSGLILIGPIEALAPLAILDRGWPAWLAMTGLLGSATLLIALAMPPRIVIYNVAWEEVRGPLLEVLSQSDPEAGWIGDLFVSQRMKLQFRVDVQPATRCVSLVATGYPQDHQSWQELETRLMATLSQVPVGRDLWGYFWSVVGALTLLIVSLKCFRDPQAVADGLQELLRL